MMTRRAQRSRDTAGLLVTLARVLFDEVTRSSVVYPAIGDMQHEMREAGDHRARRLAALCRGVWAFCKLVVLAPVISQSPVTGHVAAGPSAAQDRVQVTLVAAFLVSGWWTLMGWFTLAPLAGAFLLAATMRWWHSRHPMAVRDSSGRLPAEINFSSIPVGGDVGGLICVVGGLAILLIGLPSLRWFLVAALAAGILLACLLSRWHTSHPFSGLSQRLVPR
jgi:hypothetical protein